MSTDADNTPPADAFAGVNVLTLTERLCEASAQVEVLGGLVAMLRGELTARAVHRWAEDGTAPTFRAPGLGVVSLTVPTSKVVVDNAEEFACWAIDNHPTEVSGSLTISGIPPAKLAGLLEALQEMNLPDVKIAARTIVSDLWAKQLLEKGVAVADDGESQQVIDTRLGVAVLGVKVIAGADPRKPDGPQPTSISVRLDSQAKADAAAQAKVRLGAFLAAGVDGLTAPAGDLVTVDEMVAEGALTGPPPDLDASRVDVPVEHHGEVDEAVGVPDERPVCSCSHEQGKHGGKTGAGACRIVSCGCKRWRRAAVASAWA